MILIKIEKCGHCFYCIYRDIIEYRDNFLDNNREMIFLISPNPSCKQVACNRFRQMLCSVNKLAFKLQCALMHLTLLFYLPRTQAL
jgi:hypothetical protein